MHVHIIAVSTFGYLHGTHHAVSTLQFQHSDMEYLVCHCADDEQWSQPNIRVLRQDVRFRMMVGMTEVPPTDRFSLENMEQNQWNDMQTTLNQMFMELVIQCYQTFFQLIVDEQGIAKNIHGVLIQLGTKI